RDGSKDAAADHSGDKPPPLASLEAIARAGVISGLGEEKPETEQPRREVERAGERQRWKVSQEDLARGDARCERKCTQKHLDSSSSRRRHPHGAIGARATPRGQGGWPRG